MPGVVGIECVSRRITMLLCLCASCFALSHHQPTNKYFVDLVKQEWAVVVNKPTGKPQVTTLMSGCQCHLPKQLAGHNVCASRAAVAQA